jgi:16S rRNA (uracil1498-N3)-methyltransferase
LSARRFFVEGTRSAGETVALGPRDAHKLANVLRLRDGDAIEVLDAAGHAFDARVRSVASGAHAELIAQRAAAPELTLRVEIAQGIPKGAKMDFVIEKATELGAAAILPFYSERGIVRDLGASKLERWQRLAQTAAAQCDRRDVPPIAEPQSFEALLGLFSSYDLVLMPWERAGGAPLRAVLPGLLEGVRSVMVLIGPEGGFSPNEVARAADLGAHPISLGERILRSETAALAVLAVLTYLA